MSEQSSSHTVVALDVGTTKIVSIVGQIDEKGNIEVIGLGTSPSIGIKKGEVVNIDATTEAIQKAVDDAEQMSGMEFQSVIVGIAGQHIKGLNSYGVVPIEHGEVSLTDQVRVIHTAKTVPLASNRQILHVLTQEYIIDYQDGITEPLGMSGTRLEVNAHLVTCDNNAVENLAKCVQRCEVDVEDVVLEQIASSEAVLSDDEKELGVCMIDIGGGTSDLVVYKNGSVVHSASIPIAGDQVSSDLATIFRLSIQQANDLKIHDARSDASSISKDTMIDITRASTGEDESISLFEVSRVVQMRYEEIFSLAMKELQNQKWYSELASGIVLTGGASQMNGLVDVAHSQFDIPVRLGIPKGINGLPEVINSPKYSTAVGLLLYASKDEIDQVDYVQSNGLFDKIKSMFS